MLEKVKIEDMRNPLYYELQDAFKDVTLMIDEKKKKTLDDLINELRNTNG